ncbi:ABC transporter permease [Candidatus Micrarchaeota archaeon]|nr:ABC transporter permease [Candidatus Micrarchaeota archaeon]
MVNYISLASRNLLHRRTRSVLTVIGIFIGIAAVVALVSLSSGLSNVISGEFQKLGADKIIIMSSAGGMFSSPFASEISAHPLTTGDVDDIEKIPGVNLVGALLMKSVVAELSGESKNTFLLGIPLGKEKDMLADSMSFELSTGRDFKSTDKYAAVIGSYLADGLYKKKIKPGDKIKLNEREFAVIGVLKSVGSRQDDSQIYVPIAAMREMFSDQKLVSMIVVQVKAGASAEEVGQKILKKMRSSRHQNEGEEDFTVQTPEQLSASFGAILDVVQAIVIGIAAISLLVGGIGIMNTMYTSVLERTKEIGVMKAIGARNSHILFLFLTESGILGLIGGILGVAVGLSLALVAEIAAAQALGSSIFKAAITPELIAFALAFSFLIGAISGVLPARRASSLKPVDALRYE